MNQGFRDPGAIRFPITAAAPGGPFFALDERFRRHTSPLSTSETIASIRREVRSHCPVFVGHYTSCLPGTCSVSLFDNPVLGTFTGTYTQTRFPSLPRCR